MEMRRLGADGPMVSAVGLGCMGMSGAYGPTDEGEAVFVTLPTNFRAVQVDEAAFTSALTTLVLSLPLQLGRAPPMFVGRLVADASPPATGLAREYARYCVQRRSPGDCLGLLEDGPRLGAEDKRSLALALAVTPALAAVNGEVKELLNPMRVLATVSLSIAAYMVLLAMPEPISKGVATVFTALLWGYLGWEFFDVLRAYARLHEEAPRASTLEELKEVGERFGRVIGPNSVRILVMLGTAAIGEAGALAARAPTLPGFAQAARVVEAEQGMSLAAAASGAERVVVSVPQGTLRAVFPRHVVAMAARNTGKLLANGHRAFKSFTAFKRYMGKAGPGKEWHHIVEQTPGNVSRFGGEALHNTENVQILEKALHMKVSSVYSSVRFRLTNSYTMTVREWLKTQSYEAQRAFGLLAIENVRKGIW